jgi:hypothetical protein
MVHKFKRELEQDTGENPSSKSKNFRISFQKLIVIYGRNKMCYSGLEDYLDSYLS